MSRPPSPVGGAIRAARIVLRMTQKDAAARAGIHPVAWGRIERGAQDPSARTLSAIARALRVHPGTLFGWRDTPEGGA